MENIYKMGRDYNNENNWGDLEGLLEPNKQEWLYGGLFYVN